MRLPLIRPAELTAEQRMLYDEMRAAIDKGFAGFKTVNDQGALIGPFNASIHYPEIGRTSWALTLAVGAMGALPPSPREVAILVVGGFYRAAYEIYAHTAVAEGLGFPLARISALIANVRPQDLNADEAAAFDVAYALCRGGPLPQATWRQAVDTFGDRGPTRLPRWDLRVRVDDPERVRRAGAGLNVRTLIPAGKSCQQDLKASVNTRKTTYQEGNK